MGKFKGKNPEHKMFSDTIRDMKKLIDKNKNKYKQNVMGTG